MKCSTLKRPTIALIGLISLCGCKTVRNSDPWPLLFGTADIYKYYDGNDLPINELAIIQLDGDYCIEKDSRYYRKKFAVLPGEQKVNISYYTYNKFGAGTRSREPFPVTFFAESGRTYRPFHLEYEDLASTAQHSSVWVAIVLDVTDQEAIDSILKESPYKSVIKQAIQFSTNEDLLQHLSGDGATSSIRKTATKRLQALQFQ